MMYGRIKLPARFTDPAFKWNLASYPATVALASKPGGTKGDEFRLTQPYLDWIIANNNPKAAQFVIAAHTGFCNRDGISEAVTMWGNVVNIAEKQGEWYRLDSLRPFDLPLQSPWFKHRFTVVTRKGQMRNPGAALVVYFPFVTAEEAWIHQSGVEVSDLPLTPIYPGSTPIAKFQVEVFKGSIVWTRPGGNHAETPTRREGAAVENVFGWLDDWYNIGERKWVLQSDTRRLS